MKYIGECTVIISLTWVIVVVWVSPYSRVIISWVHYPLGGGTQVINLIVVSVDFKVKPDISVCFFSRETVTQVEKLLV